MKGFFKRFLPVLFLSLTAFFFSPLEVYLKNIAEFTFPAKHVWWIMGCFSIGSSVVYAAMSAFFPKKLSDILSRLFVGLGICIYIQSMFLNGSLQELNGENTVFSIGLKVRNILWWIVFVSAPEALFSFVSARKGDAQCTELLIILSSGFIIIQAAGLFSTASGMIPEDAEKDNYLSTDREFELSSGRNVLFFILDNCDGFIVQEALAEDPSLFKGLSGFTYYPDATTKYSRTYPAIPYLLTHEPCTFDKPYTQYISEAYGSSSFLKEIHESGTDVRLYTSLNYLSPDSYGIADNVSSYNSRSISVLAPVNLIKAMLRLGGYRGMPYILKGMFSYTIDPINRNVLSGIPENYFTLTNNDFDFHNRLTAKGVTVTDDYESTFRFYHLFGPHPGCYMDEHAGYDLHATQAQALRGDIKILNEFFDDMRENGIYDNSTIIITADHGNQNESDDLLLHNPACCIMLVKPAGDTDPEIKISGAQVCHNDLFSTVYQGLGLNSYRSEPAIYEIPEGSERERYYYHTAQFNATDGEVALREYKITGNAEDFSSWQLTGKYWDIIYSANAVSKTRLNTQ